jgi:hypothetical protein
VPRPKQVFDPLTGKRRTAEPMPVKSVPEHAYSPPIPEYDGLGRPGPHRRREGRTPAIKGRRIA